MTCIPIVRHPLGKHIPAGANARKNRTSIARQRINKQSSLVTMEAVFSTLYVQSGYKEVSSRIKGIEESSFEMPAY
jgi:hypothetical protein